MTGNEMDYERWKSHTLACVLTTIPIFVLVGDERHAQGKFWPKSHASVSSHNECKQEQCVYFGIIS